MRVPDPACIVMGFLGVALLLLLAGCGTVQEEPPLPETPAQSELVIEDEFPQIRELIQQSYDAVLQNPESALANGKLAMLLHAHRKWQPARAFYERAAALDTSSFQWKYLNGIVCEELREDAAAIAAYREALDILPDFYPGRLRLADALFTAGRLDESRTEYEKCLEKFEGAPRVQYGLGRILLERKQWEDARDAFRRALLAAPQYGVAHQKLAEAHRALGETEASEEQLNLHEENRDVEPSPNDPYLFDVEKLCKYPRDLRRRAVALLSRGRYIQGRALLEEALDIEPDNIRVLVQLMAVHAALGNEEEMMNCYRQALAIKQDFTPLHKQYGLYMKVKERWADAAEAFRTAISFDPKDAATHFLLGEALEEQNALAGAEREYRLAAELDPKLQLATASLGRLAIKRGRNEEGIRLLTDLRVADNAVMARNALSLATAHVQTGEFEQAREVLRSAGTHALLARDETLEAEVKSFTERLEKDSAAR